MENRKPGQKRRIRSHADKAALYGLLIALAFIFSYVEALIPLPVPVPGIKLGLANLVNVVGLYTVGAAGTLVVGLLRIVMVGFTFSNPGSMLYALAGGILSLAVMALAEKMDWFEKTGVSILGGVFHGSLDHRDSGGIYISACASGGRCHYGRSHWPAWRPGDRTHCAGHSAHAPVNLQRRHKKL